MILQVYTPAIWPYCFKLTPSDCPKASATRYLSQGSSNNGREGFGRVSCGCFLWILVPQKKGVEVWIRAPKVEKQWCFFVLKDFCFNLFFLGKKSQRCFFYSKLFFKKHIGWAWLILVIDLYLGSVGFWIPGCGGVFQGHSHGDPKKALKMMEVGWWGWMWLVRIRCCLGLMWLFSLQKNEQTLENWAQME